MVENEIKDYFRSIGCNSVDEEFFILEDKAGIYTFFVYKKFLTISIDYGAGKRIIANDLYIERIKDCRELLLNYYETGIMAMFEKISDFVSNKNI